jgi:DNA-binding NtrC family response regulator
MYKELTFMTDVLDQKGVKAGDRLVIKPFYGKKRSIDLSRTQYEFKNDGVPGATHKVLGSVQGEKFHFQLNLIETANFNNKPHKRFRLKSLCGLPFRINGNWSMEALVEYGDICELAYHKIYFEKKGKAKEQFNLMNQIISKNTKIINSNLPILIQGETGCGKTSLAKEIHKRSGVNGHFVHINLASLSKNLLESEIFGHVKGAFTGANTEKVGALQLSKGGTLFIDEIDSLPLDIQTKLLIFLDEKKIKPVGATFEHKVETRIICASGQRLSSLVKAGKMRQDFYFRIASGLKVETPSLRSNPEMIEKFCNLYAIENKISYTTRLLDFYKSLPWPGNLRQLKGHLDKKNLVKESLKLDFDEYDDELLQNSSSLVDISEEIKCLTMEELKFKYAKKIYFECNKNLSLTSKKLGISYKVLKRILEQQAA